MLAGGFSFEKEVSIRSGKAITQTLRDAGYQVKMIDPLKSSEWRSPNHIVFNAIHGTYGEDGIIQTLLEQEKLIYTGSGIVASKRCFNKWLSKCFFDQHALPTSPWILCNHALSQCPISFEFPLILKPVNQGSSIDVFIIKSLKDLQEKSQYLHKKYAHFLCEKYIKGQEITIGILEMPKPTALPILELQSSNEFYDYEAKYTKGATTFIIPANFSEKISQSLQQLALKTHIAMQCSGMSRVDMIVDKNNSPYILEVNTIPGFTATSDLPAQAKAYGLSFLQLIEIILRHALEKHED